MATCISRPRVVPPETSKPAFTLVELLVVIGIIAILIGVLLPALSKARKAAEETKCMNNMRQWAIALMLYTDENKGCIPGDGGDGSTSVPVTELSNPTSFQSWDSSSLWWNALPPMINMPSYYELQSTPGLQLPGPRSSSIFVCPGADEGVATPLDMANGVSTQNGMFMLHGGAAGGAGHGNVVLPTYMCYVMNSKLNATQQVQKLSQLRPAASVAAFVEKRMRAGEIPATDQNYGKQLGQLKAEEKRFTARHRSGGFISFFDGHVSWFTYNELNTPLTFTPLDYNDPNKVIWDPFGPES